MVVNDFVPNVHGRTIPRKRLLDQGDGFSLLVRPRRIDRRIRVRPRRQSFERIEILILLVLLSQCREQCRPGRADLLTPEMVVDRVLQDPLKQHRQLCGRLGGVFLGELEHRVLNDVERRLLVTHGEQRLLEGATLDLRQKGRQFGMRSQVRPPGSRRSRDYKRPLRVLWKHLGRTFGRNGRRSPGLTKRRSAVNVRRSISVYRRQHCKYGR